MTRPVPSSPERASYEHLRDRSLSQSYSESSSGSGAADGRVPSPRRSKQDEPASPLQVVFYVVCFYIVWQIFTRTDEHEFLDSASPLSNLGGGYRASLRSSHIGDHLGVNGYTLPYPQISTPSPPPITAAAASSKGFLGILFTALLFPFAQAFNLLFFALHYISIILVVAVWTLHYLTLPVTSILSVLVVVPINTLSRTASALYPLYVLLGGLIGIGVGMGVIAAWLGREVPRWIMPRPAPIPKKRSAKRRRPLPLPVETRRGYVTEDEAEDLSTPRAVSYAPGFGRSQSGSQTYRSVGSPASLSTPPPAIALRKRAPGGRLR